MNRIIAFCSILVFMSSSTIFAVGDNDTNMLNSQVSGSVLFPSLPLPEDELSPRLESALAYPLLSPYSLNMFLNPNSFVPPSHLLDSNVQKWISEIVKESMSPQVQPSQDNLQYLPVSPVSTEANLQN